MFKITNPENPRIENLFTGRTKSGKEFSICLRLEYHGGAAVERWWITSPEGDKEGSGSYIAMWKGDSHTRLRKEWVQDGLFGLVCTSEYSNERLFGVKHNNLFLPIPDFSVQRLDAGIAALKEFRQNKIISEINSLQPEDEVTLVRTITGYGDAFHLNHEKLSWEASKTFEERIDAAQKIIDFRYEDMEDSQSFARMTYGKFLEITQPALDDKRRKEKERKKKQAKIESGKALYFRRESSPYNPKPNEILTRPALEGGIYTLEHRVEKDVWESLKVAGDARYYNSEMLEDFDMFYAHPGWRYGYGAIEWAKENGFEVYINNQKISNA